MRTIERQNGVNRMKYFSPPIVILNAKNRWVARSYQILFSPIFFCIFHRINSNQTTELKLILQYSVYIQNILRIRSTKFIGPCHFNFMFTTVFFHSRLNPMRYFVPMKSRLFEHIFLFCFCCCSFVVLGRFYVLSSI